MRGVLKMTAALTAFLLAAHSAEGQVSLSLYNSLKGFGVSTLFENLRAPDQALVLTVSSDMYGVLSGKYSSPGIRMNVARLSTMALNERLTVFSGPGFTAGFARDFHREDFVSDAKSEDDLGPIAALSVTGGLLLTFDRAVSLAFSLSAESGIHIRRDAASGVGIMALYRNGLYRTAYPELSIIVRL